MDHMDANRECLQSWWYVRYSPVSSLGKGIYHILSNAWGKMRCTVSAGVTASVRAEREREPPAVRGGGVCVWIEERVQ